MSQMFSMARLSVHFFFNFMRFNILIFVFYRDSHVGSSIGKYALDVRFHLYQSDINALHEIKLRMMKLSTDGI